MRAFLEGFFAPLAGARLFSQKPRLWRGIWLPSLLYLLVSSTTLVGLVWIAHDLAQKLAQAILHPLLWMPAWAGSLVGFSLDVILVGLVLVAAGSLGMLIFPLVASIAFGRLTVQIQREAGVPDALLPGLSLWKEAGDTAVAAAEMGVVTAVSLLLPFFPAIGAVLAPLFAWYFDSWLLGMKYLDFPLAARAMARPAQRRFARQHRLHTLGLGSAILVQSMVPFLGAITLPFSIAGATLLVLRLLPHRVSVSESVPFAPNPRT